MEARSKALSYVGFALKSGKIVCGINQIESCRKKMHVVLLCRSASENARKQAFAVSNRRGIPLLETSGRDLADIVFKENCKTAAITDENLAKAIIDNMGEDFMCLSRREC